MSIVQYPKLYHYDVKGILRVWYMERYGSKHRVIAGTVDGDKVISEWKQCVAKNVGRANATTPEVQAEAEIAALYVKRSDKGYYNSPEEADAGPKFFKPMTAETYEGNLTFPVFSQPKLDGFRCLAQQDGLWSRTGKSFVSCPHIWEALAPIWEMNPTIIFDGELYNHAFKDDFNEISSLITTKNSKEEHFAITRQWVQYHIYDVYTEPLDEFNLRHRALMNMQTRNDIDWSCINLVPTVQVHSQASLDDLLESYQNDGYEGQMIRLDTPYENKRTWSLQKRKEFIDGEFPVVRIIEGKGNWAGCAKSIEVAHDGTTSKAGIRGTRAKMKEIWKDQEFYTGTLAKIQYQRKTPEGKLRMATVKEMDRTV